MRRILLLSVLSLTVSGLSRAEVVTFDETDGYTNGNSIASGGLNPAGAGFAYAAALQGTDSSVSATVSGQAMRVEETYSAPGTKSTAAAWVKDSNATFYNSLSGIWSRSVDVTLDPQSSSLAKISVAVVNGTQGTDDSIDWSDFFANFALDFIFTKANDTTGILQLKRLGSDGQQDFYNPYTDVWEGSSANRTYDISHKINVQYSFDASQSCFLIEVYDVTSDETLFSAVSYISEMASFVGSGNAMRFVAGDLWMNSGHDNVFVLDNIQNADADPVSENIITFNEANGYTNGDSIASGGLNPAAAGFAYAAALQGTDSSVSATVSGQAMHLEETYSAPGTKSTVAAWVKDSNATFYNSLSGIWSRSVDVTLDPQSGSQAKISVAVVNGTQGAGDSIDWGDFFANFALDFIFTKANDTTGVLQLKRLGSDDQQDFYNPYTDVWDGSSANRTYDISHKINVQYSFDASQSCFLIEVHDVTSAETLFSAVSYISEMASFVGSSNSMRFVAGDLWKNSGHDNVFMLDNVLNANKTPYGAWISEFGLIDTSSSAAFDADPDHDGENNLVEYALGGDPTDSTVQGHSSLVEIQEVSNTNWFEYVHFERVDKAARGLSYEPQQSTDLGQADWISTGILFVGSGVYDSEFNVVTNRVEMDSQNSGFVRLSITQQ